MFQSNLSRGGEQQHIANLAIDAFPKRLATCLYMKGKSTDRAKDRFDAWMLHQTNPIKVQITTVENNPE